MFHKRLYNPSENMPIVNNETFKLNSVRDLTQDLAKIPKVFEVCTYLYERTLAQWTALEDEKHTSYSGQQATKSKPDLKQKRNIKCYRVAISQYRAHFR